MLKQAANTEPLDYKELILTMATSGMLRHVALVRTDVSEDLSASFIRVIRIGEIRTTLAVTGNRRMQRASVASYS
jgi:DNA-binding TFAR19-related protein (PDSD5 family)